MKKQLFLTGLNLMVFIAFLAAQPVKPDPVKDLETAVRRYNALHDFTASLTAATVTEADLQRISESAGEGVDLLEPVIQREKGRIATVARYFRTMFLYEKGFALGMAGRREASRAVLRTIEPDMNSFTSGSFPMEYAYEGKNYVVKWANFAPTLGEFNVSMCEFQKEQNDFPNALAYANKANATGALSDWLKTLNNAWIMEMKLARNEHDRALVDAALAALESYSALDEDKRLEGGSLFKNIPETAAGAIDKAIAAAPALSRNGEVYAASAELLKAEKQEVLYRSFAGKAVAAGYAERGFLGRVVADAAAAGDRALAVSAAGKYASVLAATDCDGATTAAGLYETAGDQTEAARWRTKAEACKSGRLKDERRAEQEFGLYAGVYIVPLFRKDFGAVLAIQNRRLYLEGSFLSVDHKRDKLRDLKSRDENVSDDYRAYWDGYYAHLAVNFISKKGKRGARPYQGILLGYNLREFDEIRTQVLATSGGNVQATFEPVEQRYIAMYNVGLHTYSRLVAANAFFGLGGAYTQFERGNPAYEADGYKFLDPMLDNRKENRFSVMVRFGLTIGLQLGTNNRKKG